ncbi:MAG: argininosuccinate synthase [Candidatus Methanofastidiosum methylothiophilum]|uniref:argininosuccinate synthase n=1 Tax=Candidatus Methanofastidiosum methylothiophilum TaxID=1705564 RepID=A0A150JE70_9EURY|nr:MAG: argininosuccinate synthase [Candidatus Methanofastidiosum methylthiophilus]KYC57683.1 MAG: argininosuccinate synthase [Candidatus Methanofastidiosum methylthiophilus]KYC58427.1 MAG: argininosuccinate synthase [Candidatus Methanofastidiosum methylthiophilus]OQC52822.1 MAG: argininosuccinate synthase [Euryarchaeota archaeon ADurb.Bin023]
MIIIIHICIILIHLSHYLYNGSDYFKEGFIMEEILKKFEGVDIPSVKKVAVAYSGGVDSCLCIELLKRVYHADEIVPIMVDVGQGKEEIDTAFEKANILKIEPIVIDAKSEFVKKWIPMAIMANADYMGYPVSTSMTRQLIANIVAVKGKELGCDALMEGSSGKGNDQYRMHNVFKLFAPEISILVPVRDFDLTRKEEEKLCELWGIYVTEKITGGDDKTLWCRSIASGAIDLDQELPNDLWMWTKALENTPNEPEFIDISFEKGIPISLNGEMIGLLELLTKLNKIGGLHGIGKIDIFEEGIMNLKSREIYEAPGATIILKIHKDLEQMCLTKEEILFKKLVEQKWGYLVYHGGWFHPLKDSLDSYILKSQEHISGTYKVKLYKGNIEIIKRESASSLFAPEIRSIKAGGIDQRISKDAAKVMGLMYEVLAKRSR